MEFLDREIPAQTCDSCVASSTIQVSEYQTKDREKATETEGGQI